MSKAIGVKRFEKNSLDGISGNTPSMISDHFQQIEKEISRAIGVAFLAILIFASITTFASAACNQVANGPRYTANGASTCSSATSAFSTGTGNISPIVVSSGGILTLTAPAVSVTGLNAVGNIVRVEDANSVLLVQGGMTITANSTNSTVRGIFVNAGASATFSGQTSVDVSNTSNTANGILVQNGSEAYFLNGLSVVAQSNGVQVLEGSYLAVDSAGGPGPIAGTTFAYFSNATSSIQSSGPGLLARSTIGNAAVEMRAGSVVTTGANGEGLYAYVNGGTGNASVTMSGGSVQTSGDDADGIVALVRDGSIFSTIPGSASVFFNGGSISTSGIGSAGIVAETDITLFGATGNVLVTQTAGSIHTTGASAGSTDSSAGIVAIATGSASATVRQEGGSILAEGAGSDGISATTIFGNIAVFQGTGASSVATGTDAIGIAANAASGGSIIVDVAGTVQGGSGSGAALRLTGTAGSQLFVRSGATLSATSGVAVYDASGALTLQSWGRILGDIQTFAGQDTVQLFASSVTAGQILLGTGSDNLFIQGPANITDVTLLDGGDDTGTADGMIDRLTVSGGTRTLAAGIIVNWEQIALQDGANLTLTGPTLDTGSGGTSGGIPLGLSIGAASELTVADAALTVNGDVTNAGLISFANASIGSRFIVAGNYVGQSGTIGLRSVLEADASPTDRLVIQGGTATGDTALQITNVSGRGAQTISNGIIVVETTGAATTAVDAFHLASRAAAGAYEYLLFRGGLGGSNAEDWFLRSHYIGPDPVDPTDDIPLYRPEVPLYASAPALARQLGLTTLGTLHERSGEQLNDTPSMGSVGRYAPRGAWARVTGERNTNSWAGPLDVSANSASTVIVQGGTDFVRRLGDDGSRDHVGAYAAYSSYHASRVRGFAIGEQNLRVGRLTLDGPSLGTYWTHFGPSGWYIDAVTQASWLTVSAASDFLSTMSTSSFTFAGSLEAGYPIQLGAGWQFEPQAQATAQTAQVDATEDAYSAVSWQGSDSLTGRLGARLQYTTTAIGMLWQPYFKANVWHTLSGTDTVRFGDLSPIFENQFGGTSVELGGGLTARIDDTASLYAHADYRWSVDGKRADETALQGAAGIRFTW